MAAYDCPDEPARLPFKFSTPGILPMSQTGDLRFPDVNPPPPGHSQRKWWASVRMWLGPKFRAVRPTLTLAPGTDFLLHSAWAGPPELVV